MSFLEGIKNFGKKTYKFLRGNSTASTLVKVAALAFLVNKLNRNKNRDNDKDTKNIDAGVRIQVPPASDNKVPVLYGTAFFGGAITDAQMSNSNKTMTFCITLSETTGFLRDSSASTYNFKDVYWNDQRIVFKSDGFTADYTVDRNGNFDRSIEGLVKVYCYAGGTSNPVVPDNYTNNSYPNAYDVMPNWASSTHLMTNLVFAVVEINYNREKGITSLVDMKFEIANSMKLPGDVLSDYMQSTIYGAGIDPSNIDSSLDALNTFSAQGVNYADQGTGTETLADRYQINGLLDTAQPVMQNIEKITSTAGSFLKYDIHEGKFGVTINQAGTSSASFTDDNIIGNVDLSGTGLKELYNKVKVEFPHRDLKDSADFVTIEISDSDRNSNEEDNTLQLTYDILNEPVQAQLLGLIELKQSRVNAVIQFTTDYSYINLKAGDLIDVTNSRLGYTSKVFRIITIQEQQDQAGALQMQITALEYDADVYSTTNLSRFTRTDSNGIITIGSIGTPGTPQVTKFESDARPRINVESTAPTGIVEAMEFWRSTDVSLSEASRSYQLIATERPANGGVFTSGTTVTLDYDALADSDFVLKTRGINSTTAGPFSAVSGLVDFTPVQTTDAVDDQTSLSSSAGSLLGALSLVELILRLDEFFGGSVGKTLSTKLKEWFEGFTGIDLDNGVQDFPGSGTDIHIKDEGTTLTTTPASINFVGNAVTATQSADAVTVTVNTNLFSAGGTPPEAGDGLIWNGSAWVPQIAKNAVAPVSPKLDIVNLYPPDRTTQLDSTGEYASDQAPISGPYYVFYGRTATDSTANVFYAAVSLGSDKNVKLYKSDGSLIETLNTTSNASAFTITNNGIAINFSSNRDLKTDYYILMDEGVVTYCDYVSPAITGPQLQYDDCGTDTSTSPTDYDSTGTETGATSWNFNTPAYTATAYSFTGTAPTSPGTGSCNISSFLFAKQFVETTPFKFYTDTTNPPTLCTKNKDVEISDINSFIDQMNADTATDKTFTIIEDTGTICDTSNLILTWDTEVRVGTGFINLHNLTTDAIEGSVNAGTGKVNPLNKNQVIYGNINNKVILGQTHYITAPAGIVIANGSIKDCHFNQNNNPIVKSDNLTFVPSSLEFVKVVVTSANNSLVDGVDTDTQTEIGLQFSDTVAFGTTGTITLFKSTGAQHQQFDVSQTFTANNINELFWIVGNTVYLNPTVDLDLDSTYYVQISSTAIVHSDCADLSFAGISDTTTATFSTDAGPQAPQASVTNGSPSDTGIVQIYDRPVEAGTGSIVIKNSSNVTVATIPATSSAVTFEDYT
tara:strand:- start:5670 stop:9575 length:3906 start_codon:yes stop_codon:yes gene_type:complete